MTHDEDVRLVRGGFCDQTDILDCEEMSCEACGYCVDADAALLRILARYDALVREHLAGIAWEDAEHDYEHGRITAGELAHYAKSLYTARAAVTALIEGSDHE